VVVLKGKGLLIVVGDRGVEDLTDEVDDGIGAGAELADDLEDGLGNGRCRGADDGLAVEREAGADERARVEGVLEI
jgi:hypothetical protein